MVRFVHQLSEPVARWWEEGGKHGTRAPASFIHTLFMESLLCAGQCSGWLAYIRGPILTLRSSFPATGSVAEKQGPDVALHVFHHASPAMCISRPPASGTP